MSSRQHGQEGTEGRDTVDLCRARLMASVLCSLKHVPEKSYKVSEALGTEAGLLRPTHEAPHFSFLIYTYLEGRLLWHSAPPRTAESMLGSSG